MSYVWAGRLDQDEVRALLEKCSGGACWCEQRGYGLRPSLRTGKPSIPLSDEGRMFCAALEVRWWSAGSAFDVRVLADQPPEGLPGDDIGGYTTRESHIYLRGTWQRGQETDQKAWLEEKFYLPLNHPPPDTAADGKFYPRLTVELYLDAEGRAAFQRYKHLDLTHRPKRG